ncbi:MAG: sigma-70 family RNA polymerase sigma factor [Lachnospiraceae bacterium]|nr:sigma-70 family RNA polymerase sigma factor [Lachnospiraceae bacterium]
MEKYVNDETFYAGDCMSLYLKELSGVSLITAEEEVELAKTIEEGGAAAAEAKNKLVQANLRFVMYCAKKFAGRGVDLEDLNSMGIEGLYKAIDRFDYRQGYRFATYAVWWINQAISRGITAHSKTDAFYNSVSIDTKVGEDGDTTLENFIVDENAADPFETVVKEDKTKAICKVLKQLNSKESMVLKLHYGIGLEKPMTLEEIGKIPELGVSKERVRQIEKRALDKIRCTPILFDELREFAV